jgi:hypothetical protein
MAKVFNITASNNSVKLDAAGNGEVSVTISNTLGRSLRGRAVAKPLGNTGKDWLSIEGSAERDFDTQTAHQYTVKITVPPGTEAGTYTFRVDGICLENPDELYDEGQSIAIEVKSSEAPPEPKFPMWIIPVIVGIVLIIGGITTWLLLRDKGPEPKPEPAAEVSVLNVVSLPFDKARGQIEGQGLEVKKSGPKATLDFKPGQVMKQSPAAFSSVPQGQTITLTVAGDSVKVPRVKGQTLQTAMQKMSDKRLFVKVTGDQNRLNEKVVDTSPKGDAVVLKESQVTIQMPGPRKAVKYSVVKNFAPPAFMRVSRGDEQPFDPLKLMREAEEKNK